MLLWQRLAVNAAHHHRQRVQGFVEPQALKVGPRIVRRGFHSRRLLGTVERLEPDKLRLRFWRHSVDQLAELKARPGHDHRPGLDAAQPVDSFLQTEHLHQFPRVNGHRLFNKFRRLKGIVGHRFFHQPADLDRPRRRHEFVHVTIHVLAQGEFVEIIVPPRDFFIGQRPVGIELRVPRRGIPIAQGGAISLRRVGGIGRGCLRVPNP